MLFIGRITARLLSGDILYTEFSLLISNLQGDLLFLSVYYIVFKTYYEFFKFRTIYYLYLMNDIIFLFGYYYTNAVYFRVNLFVEVKTCGAFMLEINFKRSILQGKMFTNICQRNSFDLWTIYY